ncbi:hypothetical protein ACWDTT_36265 [Streptosporangium sandarakinum]
MTAPNTTAPPSEVFYLTNGYDHALYWKSGTVKGALKTSNLWTSQVKVRNGIQTRWVKVPHPRVQVWRSQIGSADGWTDVTAEFIKDGAWAW